MTRYIDAELLDSKYREGTDPQDPYSEITYLLPEDVESIPAADVEPVRHGRWIATNDENKKRCSECDIIHLIAQYPSGKANYCPNCGAKMDKEVEE